MIITVPKVTQSEDEKIEFDIEVAFNSLRDHAIHQGIPVANIPFEQLTSDGVAANGFIQACHDVVVRLLEIKRLQDAPAPVEPKEDGE